MCLARTRLYLIFYDHKIDATWSKSNSLCSLMSFIPSFLRIANSDERNSNIVWNKAIGTSSRSSRYFRHTMNGTQKWANFTRVGPCSRLIQTRGSQWWHNSIVLSSLYVLLCNDHFDHCSPSFFVGGALKSWYFWPCVGQEQALGIDTDILGNRVNTSPIQGLYSFWLF